MLLAKEGGREGGVRTGRGAGQRRTSCSWRQKLAGSARARTGLGTAVSRGRSGGGGREGGRKGGRKGGREGGRERGDFSALKTC